MKKYILDMKVTENCHLHKNYCLLKLTSDGNLPEMLPGQFVEVHVENSPTTFLRRPISVNYVDKSKNELWLLIQLVGDGTRKMAEFRPGDIVNIMLPLGNSFTIPSKEQENKRLLLIGGGVGTAPMLYLGACLKEAGFEPTFLLGARSKDDVLQLDEFQRIDFLKTRNKNLYAMSSEISGKVKPEFQNKIGSLMKTLLPAGSILGAPKPKTLEIILESETYERGFYTGVCGYFDGENLDSCVMIRFIQQNGENLTFRSGGGITHLSKLADEYQEMKNKIYVPIH